MGCPPSAESSSELEGHTVGVLERWTRGILSLPALSGVFRLDIDLLS